MILLCGLIVFAMFAMMADVPAGGGGESSAPDTGGGEAAPPDAGEGSTPTDTDETFGPPDDTIFDDGTPDETVEEPLVEGEGTPAEPSAFAPDHFEVAKQFGLTEEEARAFGSPEKFVTAMHRVLDARDSMVRAQLGEQGKPPEGQQPQLPSAAAGDDIPLFELKFENKEMLDPELVANVEGINNHYHGLFKQVRDAMRTMQAQIGPLRELQFANDFDAAIAALPEECSGILGKGDHRSLDKNGPEMKARNSLLPIMNKLASGGGMVPPLNELVNQAYQALYAGATKENQKTKARQELNGKLKKQGSQIIGRPTQREGRDNLTPDQRARKAVREYLREHSEPEVSEAELGV